MRSGSNISLSGTDSYNNLVLPLLKSLQFFDYAEHPSKIANYFKCHLSFAIGVIDGPMVGVKLNENSHEIDFIPWVRVFRQESCDSKEHSEMKKLYAIDIVHKDFFDVFISDHLIPFAENFSTLIMKHQDVIADGRAFARGFGANCWTQIEPRLEKHRFSKSRIFPKKKEIVSLIYRNK